MPYYYTAMCNLKILQLLPISVAICETSGFILPDMWPNSLDLNPDEQEVWKTMQQQRSEDVTPAK